MLNSQGTQFYPGRRLPAVCRDRVTRSAVITGHSAEYFGPYPAAVQVYAGGKRRTVSGFLSHDMAGKVCFRAYLYRANHALIPWTSHKPRLAKLARKLIAATAYSKTAEGLPSDHAAALADVCRTEAAGLTEPSGTESPGWIARRLLRRLWEEDVNRLARFFDTLGRLQSSAGE